jgi:hypothetical protein
MLDSYRFREDAVRTIISSTLALLISSGLRFAFLTDEVPTSEAAYLAKVKTCWA